ncbi:TetR/AcrR family transcriptional regulator [Vallitalea okinawensis]|uniref:TetR/AcrR family transcriptional regulator n=1 Tax=Vallitalea okinawensis TaxID=2078660 RepID=UPI000CFDE928|nr:TetR/AcrR family transcriptional regulator [Vallitalea okinawensis]
MSNEEKKEVKKKERRQKKMEEILFSAEKIFLDKGIKKTKMIDIAHACDMSKGLLYFYFKSKDEIAWRILMKYSEEEYNNAIRYVSSLKGNSFDKLKNILELFINNQTKNYTSKSPAFIFREYILEIMQKEDINNEFVEEYESTTNRNLSVYVNLLKEGLGDGSIKSDIDPDLRGKAIGTSLGLYYRYMISMKENMGVGFYNQNVNELKELADVLLESVKAKP